MSIVPDYDDAVGASTSGGDVVTLVGTNFGPILGGGDDRSYATFGPTGGEYADTACAVVTAPAAVDGPLQLERRCLRAARAEDRTRGR